MGTRVLGSPWARSHLSRPHDQMISFDRARADQVISLIIRRHREAKDAFKTLLSDVSERQPKNLQLRVA